MCRKVSIIILMILLTVASSAQTTMWTIHLPYYGERVLYLDDTRMEADELSTVNLRVVYRYSAVIDTLENAKAESLMLLETGNNMTKYGSYEKFQMDSLMKARPELTVLTSALRVLSKKVFIPEDYHEAIYHDLSSGRESVIGRIVATDFSYEEPIPSFSWQLTDEMDSWCGYTVQKAVCSFRGRTYEAWFTFDIPVSAGPWKFCGLPGLILKVSDLDRHYRFEALSVSNQQKGSICRPRYAFQKTNRKDYQTAKAQILANYPLYQRYYNNGSGIVVSPPSNYQRKELRNDLIEKE